MKFFWSACILMGCVLSGCKKDEPYPWEGYYSPFSYVERHTTVDVMPQTVSFLLKGKATRIEEGDRRYWFSVIADKTTAVENVHYKLPDVKYFAFPAGAQTGTIAITLMPENITQPVEITFGLLYGEEDKRRDPALYLDSTTVHLVPIL